MSHAQLTMLNSMASRDFDEALRLHKEWGLTWVDLRDEIYGRWVEELDLATAERAARQIEKHGLRVYCVSTNVFVEDVDSGESAFRAHLESLEKVITLCEFFRPRLVRINAAAFARRSAGRNSVETLKQEYPWIIGVYREAVDLLEGAGIIAGIENEAFASSLSTPEEFVDFFEWLDKPSTACLVWDAQNQWSSGVLPTVAIYEILKPHIGYYHLKGGQSDGDSDRLVWNAALEDSSWPVVDITSALVRDGVSPVICLNPTQHGDQKPGYDYANIVARDIAFLRTSVPDLA